tara:strand:- start:18 stop:395 length:378 start_codon:yes stop_codon:yes gene_type:complete
MPEVLVNISGVAGKEVSRSYAIYGGLIPPYTMKLNGHQYIMPGWYKLSKNEAMPNIEDIAYYPYKPKRPNLPNIDSNKVYKVKSSKGNSYYEVKMNVSGSMECSCPGYGFRRKCRHIAETLTTSI